MTVCPSSPFVVAAITLQLLALVVLAVGGYLKMRQDDGEEIR